MAFEAEATHDIRGDRVLCPLLPMDSNLQMAQVLTARSHARCHRRPSENMDCDCWATDSNGDFPAPIESITMKKEEEKGDITWEIFSKLPPKSEIILEIFSRLPPKTVFKFKSISKSISDLTRRVDFTTKHSCNCRAIASTSFTGFFYQMVTCSNDMPTDFDEIQFVPIESEAGCLPDPSLDFLKQRGEEDEVKLIDSCNGFLLCSNTNSINSVTTCFVCNPLTREKVALPHPCRRSNRVFYALLADINSSGYLQYKVVCLFRPKSRDHGTEFLILSSETGQWEEWVDRLPELHHETVMGSKVFFNGSLFWDCFDGHILICHLIAKKSRPCYELIEAPQAPLGRCLWKSEDKLLCYCHGFPNEFPAWSLHTNHKKELKWKLEGFEEFEALTEDVSRMYSENCLIRRKAMPRVRFKIIAYKPESGIMFLLIRDSVFSYQIKERRLEVVGGCSTVSFYVASGTWKFHSKSCVVPYRHSLVAIQIGKRAGEEKEREIKEEDNQSMSDLVVKDGFDELVSLYESCANKVRIRGKKGTLRSRGSEEWLGHLL